ncbi:MAG: hypothetical protein PHG16_08085, partial [Lachnospiraceae bacterium]|nr:hypothetical protein [Lachnospiraceae bacterium]
LSGSCLIVSRQFNYNIPVRSYSILNSEKACIIKACGVLQTPNSISYIGGILFLGNEMQA